MAKAQEPATETTPPAPASAPAEPQKPQVAPVLPPVVAPAPADSTKASGPAIAATVETKKAPKAWRGSSISYGHSISALTVYGRGETFNAGTAESPAEDQVAYYDPTWAHSLTLAPEWHFNDLFFARGRFSLAQEFTPSASTQHKNEVELSDIFIDVGTSGYTEKLTGLKVSGDVRFALPTSFLSQTKTQYLSIGPSLSLSRKFPVLSGLTLAYSARGTWRGVRKTSPEKRDYTLAACLDRVQSLDCQEDIATGGRNAFFDLAHGPTLSFQPIEQISVDASMTWQRVFLYKPVDAPTNIMLSPQDPGPNVRDLTRFVLSVNWQFSAPVGVSLTALTLGNQLGEDGQYIFPLFNRGTVLFLDATVDIEAVTSKLF